MGSSKMAGAKELVSREGRGGKTLREPQGVGGGGGRRGGGGGRRDTIQVSKRVRPAAKELSIPSCSRLVVKSYT